MTDLRRTRTTAGFTRHEPTRAEVHAARAADMSEAALQACIIRVAQANGWLVYHTYDSRRSTSGYPDLHLVHERRGLSLLRELKNQTGRVSTPQKEWLAALAAAGVDAGVWRPIDWFDDTITDLLAPNQEDW